MREIIQSGELGAVCMIHTWNYNDFMVRPYTNKDLDSSHGVVLNQGPHHVDTLRLLGGGMVRSVRAMTGLWDETRPRGRLHLLLGIRESRAGHDDLQRLRFF